MRSEDVPAEWVDAGYSKYMSTPGNPVLAMAAALATVALLIRAAEREECLAAGRKAWPKAHTYASENADIYRAQDHAVDRVLAAIRARGATPDA